MQNESCPCQAHRRRRRQCVHLPVSTIRKVDMGIPRVTCNDTLAPTQLHRGSCSLRDKEGTMQFPCETRRSRNADTAATQTTCCSAGFDVLFSGSSLMTIEGWTRTEVNNQSIQQVKGFGNSKQGRPPSVSGSFIMSFSSKVFSKSWKLAPPVTCVEPREREEYIYGFTRADPSIRHGCDQVGVILSWLHWTLITAGKESSSSLARRVCCG